MRIVQHLLTWSVAWWLDSQSWLVVVKLRAQEACVGRNSSFSEQLQLWGTVLRLLSTDEVGAAGGQLLVWIWHFGKAFLLWSELQVFGALERLVLVVADLVVAWHLDLPGAWDHGSRCQDLVLLLLAADMSVMVHHNSGFRTCENWLRNWMVESSTFQIICCEWLDSVNSASLFVNACQLFHLLFSLARN